MPRRSLAWIASLLAFAHLAALAVECERPTVEPKRRVLASAAHAMAAPEAHGTPAAHGAHAAPAAHGAHAAHATPAAHGAHAAHTTPAAHGTHAAHTTPAAHAAHEPSPPLLVDARGLGAELLPTCACGCQRTRGFVGGGGSRLGPVVPGVSLSRLPVATPVEALNRPVEPVIVPWLGPDPIPT